MMELHPEEIELLEAAAELREAREALELALSRYQRGECVRLFVQRAEDRLALAKRRAARAEVAMDAIRYFERKERER